MDNFYERYWGARPVEELKPIEELPSWNRKKIIYNLILPNSEVLDVGCGQGYLGHFLIKNKNCRVCGVDISNTTLNVARERGLDIRKVDLNESDLGYADDRFDAIISEEILEHLFDPRKVLREMSRVLKLDGRLIITVPNVIHWRNRIAMILGKFSDFPNNPQIPFVHIHTFYPEKLRLCVESAGFDILKTMGAGRVGQFFPNLGGTLVVVCERR